MTAHFRLRTASRLLSYPISFGRPYTTAISGPEHHTFTLPSGRKLGYATYGEATSSTPPIFFFHGTPGSRLDGRYLDQVLPSLRDAGRPVPQIISVERPGYGLSTPQHGRSHADFPRDVLALADALDISRFKVLGLSGGGPAAMGCAHLISTDRLVGTGFWAGMGPVHAAGLQGYKWTLHGAFAIWLFQNRLARPVGHAVAHFLARRMTGDKLDSAVGALRSRLDAMPEGETKIMYQDPAFREAVIASLYEMFRQGLDGYLPDADLVGEHWGFDLRELCGKRIRIFSGTKDDLTPLAMARCLTDRIGGKESWKEYAGGEGMFEEEGCLLRVFPELSHDLMLMRDVREKMLAEMVDL